MSIPNFMERKEFIESDDYNLVREFETSSLEEALRQNKPIMAIHLEVVFSLSMFALAASPEIEPLAKGLPLNISFY